MFKKLTNEELINMLVNTAHRVSILGESNDLIDLREELNARLTKRALDRGKAAADDEVSE